MDIKVNFDEEEIVKNIVKQLTNLSLIKPEQKVNIIYNADSNDIVYTVEEAAKLLKTNTTTTTTVYQLIRAKQLPALKLGRIKIRRVALLEFLEKNEWKDISDPYNIKALENR